MSLLLVSEGSVIQLLRALLNLNHIYVQMPIHTTSYTIVIKSYLNVEKVGTFALCTDWRRICAGFRNHIPHKSDQ